MTHTHGCCCFYDSDDYDDDDENHDDEPELNTGENGDNLNADHHQNLETGDTAKSLTTRTVAVEDKIHGPGAPKWVDNPGQDSIEMDNHLTMRIIILIL